MVMVVKVGGSLYDWPDFPDRLRAWLRPCLERTTVLVVPGGGLAADVVRAWDQHHQLGEEAAHWLALRSLTLTAEFLVTLLPQAVLVCHPRELWSQPHRTLAVLDPWAFARFDDGAAGALPHVWSATSDSIAARVAVVAVAEQLVLLKSKPWPKEASWMQAAQEGYVDPLFPSVLAQATCPLAVSAVDLRHWA